MSIKSIVFLKKLEKNSRKFPEILRSPGEGARRGQRFPEKSENKFCKNRENRLGFFENRAIIVTQMTLCCGVRGDTGTGGGDAAVPCRRAIDHLVVLI
jgi:hypothetical protein